MFFSPRRKIQKNPVSEYPTQLYLELSTHCNLACRTCVRNTVVDFQAAHFSPELMEQLLENIRGIPTLQRVVLLGYGEALCNPHIHGYLARLVQTGIPVCLVTNGQLLTADIIEHLIDLPLKEVFLSWDDEDDTAPIRLGSQTGKIKAAIHDLRHRRKGAYPIIGVEIVALKSNFASLPRIAAASIRAGAEQIIVTNVFPYNAEMRDQILFVYQNAPTYKIQRHLDTHSSRAELICARQIIRDDRACPFLEKGTVFITAQGDIVPCLELAHTHKAWYFNSERLHAQCSFANIADTTIAAAWASEEFSAFRDKFIYYDFPDCLHCKDSQMCRHRATREGDCFRNGTPCGECLWARGVIRCP